MKEYLLFFGVKCNFKVSAVQSYQYIDFFFNTKNGLVVKTCSLFFNRWLKMESTTESYIFSVLDFRNVTFLHQYFVAILSAYIFADFEAFSSNNEVDLH